jgi:hypothetical protein
MKVCKILGIKPNEKDSKKESDIQTQLIKFLKEQKYIYYKIESVGVPTQNQSLRSNSHKGFSDLMIVTPFMNYFVEIKALNGSLTAHQKKFLITTQTEHNTCVVASSLAGLQDLLSGKRGVKYEEVEYFN